MAKLPKLKVTWYSRNPEDETICGFEEANDLVFSHGLDVLVFVEGQMVSSYEGLLRLATEDRFKNKDILKVTLVSVVAGG
jgi:hypothetical protein